MRYNPMSEDDYDAIRWLEERSKNLNSLNNAWNVLRSYYEECKKELLNMDNSISPFADPKEKNSIYNLAKEELNNIEFVKEVEDFLHISKDEILDIIDKKENDFNKEWIVAKVVRLYNMHLKLGHSARITYVAEQELEGMPKGDNHELLERTILLSALLHDAGRFYQAAHYNNLIDSYMKLNEAKIGELDVDHAIAGYYYSLASALELHKLTNVDDQEEIMRYVTEAVAAVVVKCHQKSNTAISYFDYNGSSKAFDENGVINDLQGYLDKSYDNAKLMNYEVEVNPKHKEFIDRFIDKMKSILFSKELDYSSASGFDVDTFYADLVYDELNTEIRDLLKDIHGKSSSDISDSIVDIINNKVSDLDRIGLTEEEKSEYKQIIEEQLSGMLNFDIATSIEEQFKNNNEIPDSIRYLISSSMSTVMDADKIDILNQRALGIYNTSYYVDSLECFPVPGKSLREILNEYFKFNLNSNEFVIDSKIKHIINNMNPNVRKMIKEQLGDLDIFDYDKIGENVPIVLQGHNMKIGNSLYPADNLYNLFNSDYLEYCSNNMGLDNLDFKEFKKKYVNLLQLSISREDFDSNIASLSEDNRTQAYRNLLVSDGMEERFKLEQDNGIQYGWILDSNNSEHIVKNNIGGLVWQLNQFIMVNMRNKHSYEFIKNNHILDQILEQYEKKDPEISRVVKDYIDYCKVFIDKSLEEIKTDTLTSEMLGEMREKVYNQDSGEAISITY